MGKDDLKIGGNKGLRHGKPGGRGDWISGLDQVQAALDRIDVRSKAGEHGIMTK